MRKEARVGEQTIVYDRDATVALYKESLTTAGADRCSCIYCKNFAAQRGSVYPEKFLTVLNDLGGDPGKEWEAFNYDFQRGRPRSLYGGWFVFCGELIEGAGWRPQQEPGPFAYWFTTSFPTGQLPKDVRLCALEFCAELAWVIKEPPSKGNEQ